MITNVILAVLLVGGYFLAKKIIKEAKRTFRDLINEMKHEKFLVESEKQKVERGLVELKMAADRAEKATVTARLVSERMADPKWMRQFNEGRENAPWN